MTSQLRIARPVTNLAESVAMYTQGLGLDVLGSFEEHEGFDGTMLGIRGENVHFEFTFSRLHPVAPTPTAEDLLVFYLPEMEAWQHRCKCLLAAGFKEVPSFNPYWSQNGRTFEDRDGYRLVVQRAAWSNV
ncbi:MAG: VOC family protein [Burkholderiales bacterium]|jgi:catechol 2,3-dioxygenase-like lactoylglutathione lyase family enzyme|nr:VOC family protein [Rhodocyclaceae bacterium]MCA3022430.1 VOC family protein [Rhodocyclaceae bacterium]MCA3052862.1 VOC family protein [Rhodocyclaceae bacterium]